jgi:glyoxylase I family protein
VEWFYTKHFGFKRVRVVPLGGDQIVFIKSGNLCFEVFRAEDERPVPPADKDGPHYPGLRHVAFQVDDIDAKLAEMGSAAKITLGPLNFDDFLPGWRIRKAT